MHLEYKCLIEKYVIWNTPCEFIHRLPTLFTFSSFRWSKTQGGINLILKHFIKAAALNSILTFKRRTLYRLIPGAKTCIFGGWRGSVLLCLGAINWKRECLNGSAEWLNKIGTWFRGSMDTLRWWGCGGRAQQHFPTFRGSIQGTEGWKGTVKAQFWSAPDTDPKARSQRLKGMKNKERRWWAKD